MNQFQDVFSQEIWGTTYKDHGDLTLSDTFRRIAKYIASVETTPEKKMEWEEKFYDLLSDFKGVAGGRIMANAGTSWGGTTLMNCYVGPISAGHLDSINGIYKVLVDQANTLKSEGGWGMNFSWMRPRGSFIDGIGVDSPGSVKFMELFDKSSEIVTAGSGKKSSNKKAKKKIRKGAMMGVLDVWHPDIIEFTTAKQTQGRLSKFNMSVNCTQEFMEVINNINDLNIRLSKVTEQEDVDLLNGQLEKVDIWNLEFPDTKFVKYNDEWAGNLREWKSKGYPVIIHNTIKATWLWNLIMESTYNRNEPGVLFLDRANDYNPLNYSEKILATNPCFIGETEVLTKQGYKKLDSLVGQKVEIWNNQEWSEVEPRVTAENQEILNVTFSEGSSVSCTPYHRFVLSNGSSVEAKDLQIGNALIEFNFPVIEGTDTLDNAYARGVYSGDGSIDSNEVWLYGEKIDLIGKLPVKSISDQTVNPNMPRKLVILDIKDLSKTFVPDVNYEVQSRLDWLAGLIDTDGCECGKGAQISSIDKGFLLKVKRMLNTLGVNANLQLMKPAQLKMMPDGKGGQKEYQTQDCWRINISGHYIKCLKQLGFETHRVDFTEEVSRNNYRSITITNISKREGLEPKVYCFNEPKLHMGIFNGIALGQCGEQTLAPGGVCCLGTLNLTQFLKEDMSGIDVIKLRKYVPYLVRFLDNVSTISDAPLPEYKDSMNDKRRIGCGIMGWGSALFMMKVRFGSPEAAIIREELMSTYAKTAYEASIDLAIEKGKFTHCIPEKHVEALFVKNLGLSDEYTQKLRTYGIRNSSVLSQQPNGNSSIFANIITGGMEPMFMCEYIRTCIVQVVPAEIAAVTPKYTEGQLHETEMFKWVKEGDEDILRGIGPDGTVYKIDSNRGLTKEVLCEDYGVRYLKAKGEWDPKAPYVVTTTGLTVGEHVEDLQGFARWTDSACSKTCNIPNEYPFENFKSLYLDVYNTGVIKGFTTYRSGTMTSVLSAKDEATADIADEEIILDDIKLPDSLPATLKTLRTEGRKWYLTVIQNEAQTRPVALFVQTNAHEKSITANDAVERLLALARTKSIPEKHISSVEEKMAGDNNPSKICRTISLCLRHGILIKNIVAALGQVDCMAGTFVFHIRKFLATHIKDGEKVQDETCGECGSKNVVYQEGCKVCANCGSSKCG